MYCNTKAPGSFCTPHTLPRTLSSFPELSRTPPRPFRIRSSPGHRSHSSLELSRAFSSSLELSRASHTQTKPSSHELSQALSSSPALSRALSCSLELSRALPSSLELPRALTSSLVLFRALSCSLELSSALSSSHELSRALSCSLELSRALSRALSSSLVLSRALSCSLELSRASRRQTKPSLLSQADQAEPRPQEHRAGEPRLPPASSAPGRRASPPSHLKSTEQASLQSGASQGQPATSRGQPAPLKPTSTSQGQLEAPRKTTGTSQGRHTSPLSRALSETDSGEGHTRSGASHRACAELQPNPARREGPPAELGQATPRRWSEAQRGAQRSLGPWGTLHQGGSHNARTATRSKRGQATLRRGRVQPHTRQIWDGAQWRATPCRKLHRDLGRFSPAPSAAERT